MATVGLTVAVVLLAAAIALGIAALDRPEPVTWTNVDNAVMHPVGKADVAADVAAGPDTVVDYARRHPLPTVAQPSQYQDYALRHPVPATQSSEYQDYALRHPVPATQSAVSEDYGLRHLTD